MMISGLIDPPCFTMSISDISESLASVIAVVGAQEMPSMDELCFCPENVYKNLVRWVKSLVDNPGVVVPILVTLIGVKILIKSIRESNELIGRIRKLEEEILWLKKENLYTFKEIRMIKKRCHEMGDSENMGNYWWKKEYVEESLNKDRLNSEVRQLKGAGEGNLATSQRKYRHDWNPKSPKEKHAQCLNEVPLYGNKEGEKVVRIMEGEVLQRFPRPFAEENSQCTLKKEPPISSHSSPDGHNSSGGSIDKKNKFAKETCRFRSSPVQRTKDVILNCSAKDRGERNTSPNATGDSLREKHYKEVIPRSKGEDGDGIGRRLLVRSRGKSPEEQKRRPTAHLCYCPKDSDSGEMTGRRERSPCPNLDTDNRRPTRRRSPPPTGRTVPRVSLYYPARSAAVVSDTSVTDDDRLSHTVSRSFAKTSLVVSDRNLISSISWLNTGEASRMSTLLI